MIKLKLYDDIGEKIYEIPEEKWDEVKYFLRAEASDFFSDSWSIEPKKYEEEFAILEEDEKYTDYLKDLDEINYFENDIKYYKKIIENLEEKIKFYKNELKKNKNKELFEWLSSFKEVSKCQTQQKTS